MFEVIPELRIGSVVEVEGTSVRIELSGELDELTKTYGGYVYKVGQVGSLIKIHHGRQILLAYVRMLRMRSEIEDDEIPNTNLPEDARILDAHLFGEGVWNKSQDRFHFHRGVKTYPLPGQNAYLSTRQELHQVYKGAQQAHIKHAGDSVPLIKIGNYFGADSASCRLDVDRLFSHHCAVLGATGSGKSATVASLLHSLLSHETASGESLRPRVILVVDPHGEYVNSFGDRATVYRAYDTPGGTESEAKELRLPYWLMNGEEFRDLVIGKTEYEATSENNIVRKALEHARLVERG